MNYIRGYKFVREDDNLIEKIKDFKLINRLGDYDVYLKNGKYLLFDAIGIYLFKIKTKINLTDENSMLGLISSYEDFKFLSYFKQAI